MLISKYYVLLLILLLPYKSDTYIAKSTLSTPEYEEFAPIKFKNGILYASNNFSTNSVGNNPLLSRIFYSEMIISEGEDSFWDSELLSETFKGNISHQSPGDFVEISNELYYTTNNREKSYDRIHKLGISKCLLSGLKMRNAKQLNINNPYYSLTHPTLSEDGKSMILTSDKDGSFDLFQYTTDQGETWLLDRKITELESEYDEIYPNLINDTTLVFSSNMSSGIGGFDLYISKKGKDGLWERPENLDFINSEYDEYSFLELDSLTGYFTSNRENNQQDIFYYRNYEKKY